MNGHDEHTAALIQALDDPHKPEIRAAVDALVELAPEKPALKAALEQALARGSQKNLWALAYVLGHLPQPSDAAVRALLAGLDQPDADIRWAIALLLVRMAASEPSIVNLLTELCCTGSPNQRRMSVYCIRDLQLADEASLQALLHASADVEPQVRVAAVTSLRTRKDPGLRTRERLLELYLTDPDVRVCNAAAVSLAQLGSPSNQFLAALREAASCEHPMRRKAAAAALSLLENKRPASTGSVRNR